MYYHSTASADDKIIKQTLILLTFWPDIILIMRNLIELYSWQES